MVAELPAPSSCWSPIAAAAVVTSPSCWPRRPDRAELHEVARQAGADARLGGGGDLAEFAERLADHDRGVPEDVSSTALLLASSSEHLHAATSTGAAGGVAMLVNAETALHRFCAR